MDPHRTAKVWKNFNLTHDLKGHQQSVWAVLAVDEEQYLTGTWVALQRALDMVSLTGLCVSFAFDRIC